MQEPEPVKTEQAGAAGAETAFAASDYTDPEQSAAPSHGSRFALGVAAVVVAIVLVAVGAVQWIFSNSYNENLTKLKGLVSTASSQLEQGDTTPGATITDQYSFYQTLYAQIDSLSTILEKLNASYPYYFFRADASGVGLKALEDGKQESAPKLEILKNCADEDAAVSGELGKLLDADAKSGLAAQFSDLLDRNGKVGEAVSGVSLTGAAEQARQALQKAVEARSAALGCLKENASIEEAITQIMSDSTATVDTASGKLKDLQARSDALAAKVPAANLASFGEQGAAIAQQAGSRGDRIQADIAYLGKILPLQANVVSFCSTLDAAPSGKFVDKMKTYSDRLTQLKALQSGLDAANADASCKDADKLTIDQLAFTQAGRDFLTGEKTLDALNTAWQTSLSIDSQIAAIMKDTKTKMQDKVTKLTDLVQQNQDVITALSGDAPEDLKDQLAKVAAGLGERGTFLNDYMDYLIAKDNSDNAYRTAHSTTGAGAAQAQAQYKAALKITTDAEAKYKASQSQYLSMMDV